MRPCLVRVSTTVKAKTTKGSGFAVFVFQLGIMGLDRILFVLKGTS